MQQGRPGVWVGDWRRPLLIGAKPSGRAGCSSRADAHHMLRARRFPSYKQSRHLEAALHTQPAHALPCGCLSTARAGPPGKSKGGQPKQNLFLIYVDALSVVNNKRAGRGPPPQQQQGQGQSKADQQQQQQFEQQLLLQRDLSAAAPNMPDFTLKDLQFILTFTGEIALPQSWGVYCRTRFTATCHCPALHNPAARLDSVV